MSESRDPAIKLFGKTIPLPPAAIEAPASDGTVEYRDLHTKEVTPESTNKDDESPETEEKGEPHTPSRAHESFKPSSTDQETAAEKDSTDENEADNSQEKTPKKPDKILPCPRCNSMDTKFCYYNNYNVNQPRHFCKNCQRYWTAGGAMRNVPVGAGRRKNKSSASQYYRHLTMSTEAYLRAAGSDAPQTIRHSPPMKPNETVLRFSSEAAAPVCDSMTSALNLGEKTMKNCQSHRMNEKVIPFTFAVENGDEHSTISSAAPPNSGEEGTRANSHRIPAPIPCFNGSPWPYPWTTAPAFCTSGFSIPVYPPTTFWRCAVPGNWSIPFVSHVLSTSPESDSAKSSEPNSPSLGKHSREGDVIKHNSEKGDHDIQNKQERCRLWVPKTLRIDNPDEAARSSIWAMMDVKNDKTDEVSGRRMFRAFQPKAEMKGSKTEASQALHTNPAALSRSLSFQESS